MHIEILPFSINKGSSLNYVCKTYLKCSPQDVIAFGDSMNDCDMLDIVGKGVIVKNGQPDILNWYS